MGIAEDARLLPVDPFWDNLLGKWGLGSAYRNQAPEQETKSAMVSLSHLRRGPAGRPRGKWDPEA